ncbi:MAG: hypothetical protein ACYCQK_11530 [Acidiferrobacteraceae bacterium]
MIIAEIGSDMSRFRPRPSRVLGGHVPGSNITGGKRLEGLTRQGCCW